MEKRKSQPAIGEAEFVGAAIEPLEESFDTSAMARGEPGLPRRFRCRGVEYAVVGVIQTWKSSGPCRNGSDEMYLRRHWYKVQTQPHAIFTIYCERQARSRKASRRWFAYTVQK